MTPVWGGVDVGDLRKGFHVVVIDAEGLVDGPTPVRSAAEAVRWLTRFEPILTAVDSPISAAPEGHRLREEERRLKREVCGIRWTPDIGSLEANPGYYGWIFHGFELHHALRDAGLGAVECFPTASWTRWAGARGGTTRARWTREALSTLGLAGLPSKTNQDDRDAIAAAVTARMCSRGRIEHFGEIVVPLPS